MGTCSYIEYTQYAAASFRWDIAKHTFYTQDSLCNFVSVSLIQAAEGAANPRFQSDLVATRGIAAKSPIHHYYKRIIFKTADRTPRTAKKVDYDHF